VHLAGGADDAAGQAGPLVTSRRIVMRAVCQPLAARPAKIDWPGLASSRWKGCGSNWRANAVTWSTSSACASVLKVSPDPEVIEVQDVGHAVSIRGELSIWMRL
jgi:hypothetical protein